MEGNGTSFWLMIVGCPPSGKTEGAAGRDCESKAAAGRDRLLIR